MPPLMRDLNFPFSPSKRKLLDAAEELFAEKGFDLVSVRDITKAAKANVAAVNYHFGGREQLIALVVIRYIQPVNEERLARLEMAEKKWPNKQVPLEEILDAFVRPLVTAVRKSELSERLYCRMLGRILGMREEAFPPVIFDQLAHLREKYAKAITRVLPGLPEEDLIWRMHFTMGGMIHMLSHQEMLARMTGGASGTLGADALVARFTRYAAAGLQEGLTVGSSATAVKKGPQEMFDF